MNLQDIPMLISKTAIKSLMSVDKNNIAANLKSRSPWVEKQVGVIPINGVLMNEDSFFASWFGGTAYQHIRQQIEQFNADTEIKAILLDINSVGGDSAGCAELAEYINSIEKPVIAYVSADCFSAAYYLASAAKQIISHRTGAVGSIGTLVVLEKNEGEIFIFSSQSPAKVPDPTPDEGQAQIRSRLDSLTNEFISDVAQFREKELDYVVENFGQGDVVSAKEALAKGMIDKVGNFKMALDIAATSDIKVENENKKPEKQIKQKSRGLKMAKSKKIKNALVIVESEDLTEEVPMIEVTVETIKTNFPEVAEALIQEGKDKASEVAKEVDEVAETANPEDEEEMKAVAQARSGEISASQLSLKLLQIRKESKAKSKQQLAEYYKNRALDQPAVAAVGGVQPGDVKNNVASRLKALRGGKK